MDPALLAVSDWVIPNEVEFAGLAGASTDATDDGDRRLRRRDRDPGRGHARGRGAQPCSATDGVVHRIPASPCDAVDTTGAGDAFVGAFAYGLASGLDERAAVTLGVRCASDSVLRPGTQKSFPSTERARSFLDGLEG